MASLLCRRLGSEVASVGSDALEGVELIILIWSEMTQMRRRILERLDLLQSAPYCVCRSRAIHLH